MFFIQCIYHCQSMKGGEKINKKRLAIIVFSLMLITLVNMAYATDAESIENSTEILSLEECNQTIDSLSVAETPYNNLTIPSQANDNLSASKSTYIDAEDEVTYDVIGQNFEVKLLTSDNKPVSNAKIKFLVNGESHESETDSNGVTSFKIRLDDGQYKLTTQFAGNSKYKSCSKQTLIKINNTRYVSENLTSMQIQDILDNAKANNVIIFKGDIYENVNLVINKRLVLTGNGNTILKSGSNKPIIEIMGKKSSLSSVTGFNIQSKGDGIRITDSDYVSINQNNISGQGNGIIAENVKYMEIDSNSITNNKNGIVLGFADDCNIINNSIKSNSQDGIALSKSNNVYIYYNVIRNNQNGISTSKEIDNVYYGGIPANLHIGNNEISSNYNNGIYLLEMGDNLTVDSNTINSNHNNGIAIAKTSNNMNITSNIINYNHMAGIEISKIGSNNIQFNLIYANSNHGIKFSQDYSIPNNQNIRFNVIYSNPLNEIDASETGYDHYAKRLEIGENWYGGAFNICPKIKTENINVSIVQVDTYLFNVTFYDSDNNIVSKLPSRIVTHRVNNGRSKSFVLYNGTGTFERDASDDDIIHVSIDMATFSIVYKFDDPNYLHLEYPPYSPYVRPIDDVGKPYPNLPRPGLIEDIPEDAQNNTGEPNNNGSGQNDNGESNGNGNGNNGNGNGNSIFNGNGNGNGGVSKLNGGTGTNLNKGTNSGTGNSASQHNLNGNGTAMQDSNSNNNPSNGISSSLTSSSPGGSSSASSESTVKKIIIEEENAVKVSGISLIILLILLTALFYYRDDLKEMKSD